MTGMWHPCAYEEYALNGHPEVGQFVCGVITPLRPGVLPLARLRWVGRDATPREIQRAQAQVRVLAFQAWETVS
jgi:hypothetical protein